MGAAASTTKVVGTGSVSSGGADRSMSIGLENFGTTCYCNSIIQALYFCSPFRKNLFEYNKMIQGMEGNPLLKSTMPSGRKRHDALLIHLTNLFYDIGNSKGTDGFISPSKFVSKVRKQNSMFDNDEHHDAHEFLNFLLNDLIESINFDTSILKTRFRRMQQHFCMPDENEKTWVENVFGGTIQCKMTCITCGRTSIVNQAVLDISVETVEDSTLSDCLLRSTDKEYMRSIDKIFCAHCNSLQEGERTIRMIKPPIVLAIHLKRFKFVEQIQQHKKLRHKVMFPDTLELQLKENEEQKFMALYKLNSVIAHVGNGPMEGHYVAMVRNSSSSWVLFDDDVVKPISDDLVKLCYGSGEKATTECKFSQTGYILFYEL